MILLNTKERIEAEREFITLLRDAHLAKEIFAEAAAADDPVEVWHDGLSCELAFVEPGTPEFERVAELFDVGQSPKNSNFYESSRSPGCGSSSATAPRAASTPTPTR
jgi:hypothetical protein